VRAPAGFRGAFRSDKPARSLYAEGAGIYRIVPAAVAVPENRSDLVTLVKWAADTATALVPRGAGSGMPGHNIGPGVIVDLSQGFNEAPVVAKSQKLAHAGAGITYSALAVAAGVHGLRLPPDPSSARFCTLGGMTGTNAAGARSFKYGAMRRWVEALEIVTADGEPGVITADGLADARTDGPTAAEKRFRELIPDIDADKRVLESRRPFTRKNSSGYALFSDSGARVRDVLVGSEGTLAFITGVTVRLDPVPARVMTLLMPLARLEDLPAALDTVDQAKPSAVELLDRTYLEFIRALGTDLPADTEAALLVELEPDGIQAFGSASARTNVTSASDEASQARLWGLRHRASPILAGLPDTMRSLQVVEDGCVPRPQLATYIAGLRDIARNNGFQVVIFGHAGDGHVHANLLADIASEDLAGRLTNVLSSTSQLQIALDGTISGEHGDGRLRAPFVAKLFGEPYLDWCRRVKQAWDPAGILNPGVKIPHAGPAIEAGSLKVGAGAPKIAEAIAAHLRRIEKEAAWDSFRLDLLGDRTIERSDDRPSA